MTNSSKYTADATTPHPIVGTASFRQAFQKSRIQACDELLPRCDRLDKLRAEVADKRSQRNQIVERLREEHGYQANSAKSKLVNADQQFSMCRRNRESGEL